MKQMIFAMSLLFAAATPQAFGADKKTPDAQHTDLAPEVSLEELQSLVKSHGAVIVDANGSKVYEEGHIPGAISFAKNEGKLAQVLPKDKASLIVAYCGGPLCLAWQDAAKEAKKNGYTNLKHFKGGIKGWKEAKLPVETGADKS